jgi:VWFA-related protein
MVAVLVAAAWTVGRTPGLVAFAMPQLPAKIAAPVSPPQLPAPSAAATVTPTQPATLTAAAELPAPLPPVAAPEPPTPPARQIVTQVNTALVLIPVEVTDPGNRFVTGLSRENFKLSEDGVEQQISQFSSEELPISVGIVVDVSGSMGAKMQSERAAVSEFLKTARPQDEFFLMPFSDVPVLTVPFTHDTEAIQNSLRNAQTRGGTSLRDAVFLAIFEMKKARNSRRAILIVSDGSDNTSSHSASEMAATLQEADLQLYAISLADRPDPRTFAGILEKADHPGRLDAGIDNVTSAPTRAARIAVSLRNLYVLSYTSNNTIRDGKYRRVQVQIVPPVGLPPLRVTYRAGYYAQ